MFLKDERTLLDVQTHCVPDLECTQEGAIDSQISWAMVNVHPDQIGYISSLAEATSNLPCWMEVYMVHNRDANVYTDGSSFIQEGTSYLDTEKNFRAFQTTAGPVLSPDAYAIYDLISVSAFVHYRL
ncbi:hypothetical protein STEG23_003716 [Scotinomys teguina]